MPKYLKKAIKCIKHRCVYDIAENKFVFVNILIYYDKDLMIKGYTNIYKVDDYGKTWRDCRKKELEVF